MFKENYLELLKSLSGFEIIAEIDDMGEPEEVTPIMLWNIWDITSKFGQLDRVGQANHERISFFHPPLFMEIYDRRLLHPVGSARIFVTQSQETKVPKETIYGFRLKNGINVLWDKGLSIERFEELVAEIDKKARDQGFIKDEVRFDQKLLPSNRYLLVNKIFQSPETFLILPADEVDLAKSNFDHPELVIDLEYDHAFCLCLKSEQDKMGQAILKSSQTFKNAKQTSIITPEDYKLELQKNLKIISKQ